MNYPVRVTKRLTVAPCAVLVLMLALLAFPLPAFMQGRIQGAFIAWSPDGSMIAVGSGITVSFIEADTMQVLNAISVDSRFEQSAAPVWSPDGQRLAAESDANVEIWQQPWDPARAQRLITCYQDQDAPPASLSPIKALAWSPDGTQIAVGIASSLSIWDAATCEPLRYMAGDWGYVLDLDWFPDGRLALAGASSNAAHIVDLDTETELARFQISFPGPGGDYGVSSVDFSPDGSELVLSGADSNIRVWEDTGVTMGHSDTVLGLLGDGHTGLILSVAWSPDGERIASCGADGTVRIWNAETAEQLEVIEAGENVWIHSVEWSPDGGRLAYGGASGVTVVDFEEQP